MERVLLTSFSTATVPTMEIKTLTELTLAPQTVAIAVLVIVACAFFQKIHLEWQVRKLPAFHDAISSEAHRKQYIKSAKRLYREGYEKVNSDVVLSRLQLTNSKFKDSVWRVTSADGFHQVVVSPSLLPELRKIPDSVLSIEKAVAQFFEVKYTRLLASDRDIAFLIHSIKSDLTPALARLNGIVYTAVEEALKEEMPADCEDWTPVKINAKLITMVAKITGLIFVGPELCHNEDYVDSAINYPGNVVAAAQAVKLIRPFLRPWLAPRLPELRKLDQTERKAMQMLEPIVKARRDAQAKDPDLQQPNDTVHTTSTTVTNVLYTLAASPEYIEPLREEVRQAIAENGGTVTSRALERMVKLDSYMKETSRFYSGIVNFQRKVVHGFTLSNGQYIPPGVIIEAPSHAIYMDDANFPRDSQPAEVFDGFRYYKLRQSGLVTDHARNLFVTTNEHNLGFGYGKHACPGRFFAANEIKMLLARLLLDYDFKNEGDSMERYPPIEIGGFTSPDPSKNLLFRKHRMDSVQDVFRVASSTDGDFKKISARV
uniref:Ent-kaurene oxidase n=1 Tax=Talaromyces marneffei PM1 TaxID=1077442 RepID=A0A093UP30_TALMA